MNKKLISMIAFMALVLTSCGGGGDGDTPSPTNSDGTTPSISDGAATAAAPSISIADTSVVEGNSSGTALLLVGAIVATTPTLDFTVTLSTAASIDITMDYTIAHVTTDSGDFAIPLSGNTLTIPAGSTTGTISVSFNVDSTYEADETMTITLSNPANATLGTAVATGTITNDDTMPSVAVSAVASITEGNIGFKIISPTITLSAISGVDTIISYSTVTRKGTGGGTVTILAGQQTGTARMTVFGDRLYEANETATITITNATNATINTATATTSITNDDAKPSLSIAAASVTEGNAGTSNLDFTVTLTAASGTITTVNYATFNGTALAASDFTATSGTLSIPVGSTTGTISVAVSGDTTSEADETLTLTLSNPVNATVATTTATGTITNDDAAPVVNMTVSGKSLDFTWSSASFTGITAANIDHYRILVNPDGASGFTVDPYATNITSTATSHSLVIPVHKTNWLAAQYTVEACNLAETVCGTSANQTLALIDSVAATVYVKASNTDASDLFGFSLSLSGDGNTLAVGTGNEDSSFTGINGSQTSNTAVQAGAVYVFSRAGNTWVQQAYVKASNAAAGDLFGSSVSLSTDGNTMAVGAYREDSGARGVDGNQASFQVRDSGAVYVFSRTGTTWTEQAYVKAAVSGSSDFFGFDVSLSGDGNTLAVGAFQEGSNTTGIGGSPLNNLASRSGAVYVFSRTATTWTQQAYVKASNTGNLDQFGVSLSLSADGNTMAVGAYGEDSVATGIGGNQLNNTARESGAAYVFSRTATTWTQQAYVKASNTGGTDAFGRQVTLSADGNTMAVTANQEDSSAKGVNGNEVSNASRDSGAVYVFSRTVSTWTQQAYVKAFNTGASDKFGYSVSLSADGSTMAVGAFQEDSSAKGVNGDELNNVSTNSGAAYVFSRTGNAWMQKSYVKASNTATGDNFGQDIGLSGDGNTLAVSAINEDGRATGIGGSQVPSPRPFNSGAVYLY